MAAFFVSPCRVPDQGVGTAHSAAVAAPVPGAIQRVVGSLGRHRAAVERETVPTRVGPVPVAIGTGAALAGDAGESLEEIGGRAYQSALAAKRAGRKRVALAPTSRRD